MRTSAEGVLVAMMNGLCGMYLALCIRERENIMSG